MISLLLVATLGWGISLDHQTLFARFNIVSEKRPKILASPGAPVLLSELDRYLDVLINKFAFPAEHKRKISAKIKQKYGLLFEEKLKELTAHTFTENQPKTVLFEDFALSEILRRRAGNFKADFNPRFTLLLDWGLLETIVHKLDKIFKCRFYWNWKSTNVPIDQQSGLLDHFFLLQIVEDSVLTQLLDVPPIFTLFQSTPNYLQEVVRLLLSKAHEPATSQLSNPAGAQKALATFRRSVSDEGRENALRWLLTLPQDWNTYSIEELFALTQVALRLPTEEQPEALQILTEPLLQKANKLLNHSDRRVPMECLLQLLEYSKERL